MKPLFLLLVVVVAGCAPGALTPAAMRLSEDACAHCRMAIVSMSTAAQIVAPGEEPSMFDEIGCLRDYLAEHPLAAEAIVFVADHRTGEWIDARAAVFTQTAASTPMSSGLVAHRDLESRDADPAAHDGRSVAVSQILLSPERTGLP